MAESALHQRLVRYLVSHARDHGVEVEYAALPGYPQPYSIGGFRPDMLGWFGDVPVVGEAETAEGLRSKHTRDQLRVFGSATGNGQSVKIALAVPRQVLLTACEIAMAAGIPPGRLVPISLPARARHVSSPGAARTVLLERGRERPVAPPGTMFQRGRTKVSPLSRRAVHQAALNARARRIARELLAQDPLSPR